MEKEIYRLSLEREEAYEALVEALDSVSNEIGVIQANSRAVVDFCMEALGFGMPPYE